MLNTKFQLGVENTDRLLEYIHSTPIIYDFIQKNNKSEFDIKELNEIRHNEGYGVFDIPIGKSDEIAFVYQLLLYVSENVKDYGMFAFRYGSGNKIQDHSDAFNSEVVKPFINHIIEYLEELKIDMGSDESTTVKINIGNIHGGQVNLSQGGSTINAVYIENSYEIEKLINEISAYFKSSEMGDKELEEVDELLSTIKDEVKSEKPKKSLLSVCGKRLEELASMAKNSANIIMSLKTLYEIIGFFSS